MNRLGLLSTLMSDMNYSLSDFEIVDDDVNDCLLHMYFYMMTENKQSQEILWETFCKSYDALTKEKQEYVKNDFIKIIKAQDENQKQLKKER